MLLDAHARPVDLVLPRKRKWIHVSVRPGGRPADDGAQVVVLDDAHDALGVADGAGIRQERDRTAKLWRLRREGPAPARVASDLSAIRIDNFRDLEVGRAERFG